MDAEDLTADLTDFNWDKMMTRKKMMRAGNKKTGQDDDNSTCSMRTSTLPKRPTSSNMRSYARLIALTLYAIVSTSPSSIDAQYVNRNGGPGTTAGGNGNGKQFLSQMPPSNPPTVRPPPYFNSLRKCPEPNDVENWEGNLCGDLNIGEIPVNPLGHADFPGDSHHYPFELIKNKTLEFFRHALPVLKTYKSLPKVARYVYPSEDPYYSTSTIIPVLRKSRNRRSVTVETPLVTRDESLGELGKEETGRSFQPHRTRKGVFWPYGVGSAGNRRQTDSVATRVKRMHGPDKPPTHFFSAGYGGNNFRQHRGGSPGSHCENAILCKFFNTMYEKLPSGFQRLVSADGQKRHGGLISGQKNTGPLAPHVGSVTISSSEQMLAENSNHLLHGGGSKQGEPLGLEGQQHGRMMALPQTPCPSSAEYLTPVFARNHEGAWRYVVQIPREGYFTQTVEVTKCIQANCLYMDGTCRSSPRWQSLLVAEMYYPDAVFPVDSPLQTPKELQHHERRGQQAQPQALHRLGTRAPDLDIEDDSDEIGYHSRIRREVKRNSSFPTPMYALEKGGDDDADDDSIQEEGGEEKEGNAKTSDRERRSSGGRIGKSNNKKRTGNEAVYKEGRFYEGKQPAVSNNSTDQLVTANHVSESKHCDGYDEIGCYQFRLFYDWFLIPGECKCWRRPHPFY